eukprot:TRINITY_DN6351_c0_g1_i1.p1 TRINITY_DN6351_c0_g1~~TRINITY_DN6351_c0_g1_i1.p1  ORF type:complete len:453 (-),score=79.38 TRINITY_DN6351_c0_g1_i1:316-1674(-)
MKETTAMEIQLSNPTTINGSPSSSSSSSSTNPNPNPNPNSNPSPNPNPNPNSMQSWWESISRARSRIQALISILPPSSSSPLSLLADSDRPALSLLHSSAAFSAVSGSLSGSGDDPLCQWLYDTHQSPDPDLRLVSLSFLPLLSGLYLSRVVSTTSDFPQFPNLAGFEAVLLSVYSAEVKARAGKPVVVSVPDLSQPSLYHAPRARPPSPAALQSVPRIGVLSAPLEPQLAVKSTKRACIVAVTLDCYYKHISHMPAHSKMEFCEFAAAWAGQNCSCSDELDRQGNDSSYRGNNIISFSSEIRDSDEEGDGEIEIGEVGEEFGRLGIGEENSRRANGNGNGHCVETAQETSSPRGSRIPLPWELFQPVLRIVGHCLLAPLNSQEVKDAASMAVRCLYARAMHDILPQAILATRSLIQLDKRARLAAKAAANSSSNANTPTKPKKPEILLVSK